MLRILGKASSINVRKVLWACEELAIPFTQEDWGSDFRSTNSAAFLKLNPNAMVPVIIDGDFVLWESNAIVRYLAARHAPDSDLYPADLQARALADKWMDWTTSTIAAPFSPVFWGVVRTPADKQDWNAINEGIIHLHSLLLVADETLSRQPYLSGEAFGMGDIPLGCFAYAWFEMPIERPPLPHLQAWYERLKTRPAYRKAVMSPLT